MKREEDMTRKEQEPRREDWGEFALGYLEAKKALSRQEDQN